MQRNDATDNTFVWTLSVFSTKERKHMHVLPSKAVRGSGSNSLRSRVVLNSVLRNSIARCAQLLAKSGASPSLRLTQRVGNSLHIMPARLSEMCCCDRQDAELRSIAD